MHCAEGEARTRWRRMDQSAAGPHSLLACRSPAAEAMMHRAGRLEDTASALFGPNIGRSTAAVGRSDWSRMSLSR